MASYTVSTFHEYQDQINNLAAAKLDSVHLFAGTSGTTGTYTMPVSSFMVFVTRTNGTSTAPVGLYIGSAYSSSGYIYAIKESSGITLSVSGKVLSYTTSLSNMHINIIFMDNTTQV